MKERGGGGGGEKKGVPSSLPPYPPTALTTFDSPQFVSVFGIHNPKVRKNGQQKTFNLSCLTGMLHVLTTCSAAILPNFAKQVARFYRSVTVVST